MRDDGSPGEPFGPNRYRGSKRRLEALGSELVMSGNPPDEAPDRRKRFWGGQVRSILYLAGGMIAGWHLLSDGQIDPFAVVILLIFSVLVWVETCPVCGKTWWAHRTEGPPNLFKMIVLSREDCPDRDAPPEHWGSR